MVSNVDIPLSPHGDANMHDTFMTAYDKDYSTYGEKTLGSTRPQDSGSGHTSNRPVFARARGEPSPTTNQSLFPARSGALSAEQWGALRTEAFKPQELRTAFVRQGSTHRLPGAIFGAPPTITTMKDSYHNYGKVGSPPSDKAAMYSGAGTAGYDPNFLMINSPAELPARPIARMKHEVMDAHPGRGRLMHTSNLPGSYFQHSRLIGDRTLAYPSQLPVGLSNATDFEASRGRTIGARGMMDTLAGRTVSSAPSVHSIGSLCDTNPLTLSPPAQETCRVAHRVEYQGHVKGSTYQSHFINQRNLPELPDPAKDKKGKMTVALPNVKAQPHETVVLTDSRGQLLADMPQGVHPSVWKRLKTVEKTLSVDKVDPHAHKLRTVSVR